MRYRHTSWEKGFLLAEALVAGAITAIVLGATLWAVSQGLRGIRENGELVLAKVAASRQMEVLRNQPIADLPSLNAQPFTDGLDSRMQGTTFVEAFEGRPDLLRVTVKVVGEGWSWQLVSLISQ